MGCYRSSARFWSGTVPDASREGPTCLDAIERNNGECISASVADSALEQDAYVASKALRVVDIHVHDECSANLRFERQRAQDAPLHAAHLEVLCLAHKKAQVNKEGSAALYVLDSNVIRLQLATQGSLKMHLKAALRKVIRDRLVVIDGGAPSAEAQEHSRRVFELRLDGASPHQKYRAFAVKSLFNGDLSRPDQIQHCSHGAASTRAGV